MPPYFCLKWKVRDQMKFKKSNRKMFKPFWEIELHNIDVVRRGAEWAFARPEFGFSEKKTERKKATFISPLKFENLTTSLHN